jgi:hypothetical protein
MLPISLANHFAQKLNARTCALLATHRKSFGESMHTQLIQKIKNIPEERKKINFF